MEWLRMDGGFAETGIRLTREDFKQALFASISRCFSTALYIYIYIIVMWFLGLVLLDAIQWSDYCLSDEIFVS